MDKARHIGCPHCGTRQPSITELSIHVRFECPVTRPKEDAK